MKSNKRSFTLWGLVEVGCVLAGVATVLGFGGRAWWLLELATHFRVHLGTVLLAGAILWVWRRRWGWVLACSVGVVFNLVMVGPQFFGRDAVPLGGTPIRVVSLNVRTENLRSDLVLKFLRDADADIVLLMEVDERWWRELGPLKSIYTNHIAELRADNFGIVLLSRLAWTNAAIFEIGEAEIPSVVADVSVGAGVVHVLGTHALPPGSANEARLRNQQFKQIANHGRQRVGPVVVVGDLNTTPWSPRFADLLENNKLRDASKGFGLGGSWPTFLPVGRIPIDHCLLSPEVRVVNKRYGPQVGSDHLPVLLELVVKGSAAQPSNGNAP